MWTWICDCLRMWIAGQRLDQCVLTRTHDPWSWTWTCTWTWTYTFIRAHAPWTWSIWLCFDPTLELIRTGVTVDRLLLFCSGWTEPLWWGIACCVVQHHQGWHFALRLLVKFSRWASLLCCPAPPGPTYWTEILWWSIAVVLACYVVQHHQRWILI